MFILDPSGYALLLRGEGFLQTLWVIATSFLGVFAFASAASGWLMRKSTWFERALLVLAGLFLVYPTVSTDFVGMGILVIAASLQYMKNRKSAPAVDVSKLE